jgi:ribonucleoside-diphosphate reductase alpha chain
MVCLDLDHPEIVDFINWKVEEEKKVGALIAAGYPSDYEGEAYRTVSGQNSNNSVRIPMNFQSIAGRWWVGIERKNGWASDEKFLQENYGQISYAAWRCADPGTQYDLRLMRVYLSKGGRIMHQTPQRIHVPDNMHVTSPPLT